MPGNPFRGMLGEYLKAVQLKQQHEQFQQQHDLAQKQLDELTKFHQGELDRMSAEMEHNRATTAQTLRQHMIENIAKGYEKPSESSQPTGVNVQYGQPQQSNLPEDLSSVLPQAQGITETGTQTQLKPEDLGGMAKYLSPQDRTLNIATPEAIATQAATAAGQKTAAEEAAKQPGREAKLQSDYERALLQVNQRADAAEAKNILQRELFNSINATQKYKTDHPFGAEELDNNGIVSNGAHMGSIGVSDLAPAGSKLGAAQRDILARQNKVPFESKKGAGLDTLSDFDGLVQDMKDAANALPDSGNPKLDAAEATANALKTRLTPWQTDLENKMNAVRAKAPQTLRGLQNVSRVNLPEIQTQAGNTVTARMTKKEALGNIDRFQRDVYTKAYSDIMGGVNNPAQRISILAQHGGLDRWRNVTVSVAPAKNPDTGQMVDRLPVISKFGGHDHLWNPSSGQYDDIEGFK